MAHPYFTAFKVGMTVGTAIFDRTRDDPLDAVNNKLTQIMAATTKILEEIGTVKELNYKTTLSHHRTQIQKALENSLAAQDGGDVDEVARFTQNAKEGSLDVLRALTNLVTFCYYPVIVHRLSGTGENHSRVGRRCYGQPQRIHFG
jgi:hypothetical protein